MRVIETFFVLQKKKRWSCFEISRTCCGHFELSRKALLPLTFSISAKSVLRLFVSHLQPPQREQTSWCAFHHPNLVALRHYLLTYCTCPLSRRSRPQLPTLFDPMPLLASSKAFSFGVIRTNFSMMIPHLQAPARYVLMLLLRFDIGG